MSSTLDRIISRVGDLPAMPEIVSEVLTLTQDPKVSMAEVSETLQRDPGLTAKILRISNSPYYGMKQYVGTLKLALVILGVREVRNIVLGISVFDALHNDRTEKVLTSGFWGHCFTVAALAKKLGAHLNLGLQGEDFISGLLHDIGKMVLCRQLGESYEVIFSKSGGHSESLAHAEKELLGFDHAEVGAALAVAWNLPETLADALRLHHPQADFSLKDAKDPRLAALVRVVNRASHDDLSGAVPMDALPMCDEGTWRELDPANLLSGPEARVDLVVRFRNDINEIPMH